MSYCVKARTPPLRPAFSRAAPSAAGRQILGVGRQTMDAGGGEGDGHGQVRDWAVRDLGDALLGRRGTWGVGKPQSSVRRERGRSGQASRRSGVRVERAGLETRATPAVRRRRGTAGAAGVPDPRAKATLDKRVAVSRRGRRGGGQSFPSVPPEKAKGGRLPRTNFTQTRWGGFCWRFGRVGNPAGPSSHVLARMSVLSRREVPSRREGWFHINFRDFRMRCPRMPNLFMAESVCAKGGHQTS
jgi:hypothetical protein